MTHERAINSYVKGNVVVLTAAFSDSAGAPTDPTTIKIHYKSPDGVTTTYTYGSGEVVKDSTGHYHYNLTTSQIGTYFYRWEGTGAIIAADEHRFYVPESEF